MRPIVIVIAVIVSTLGSAASAKGTAPAGEAVLGLRMQVEPSVLKSGVKRGDTFQLDVVLNVRGQDAVDELEMPDVTDFSVVSEQESSDVKFFVQGGRRVVIVEHRRTLLLRADEVGIMEIGDAAATLGESSVRAGPIRIRVREKAGGGARATSEDEDDDDDDDVNDDDKKPAAANSKSSSVADAGVAAEPVAGARFGSALPSVFLEVVLDKQTAVVGEQITAIVEIWTERALSSYPRVAGQKPPGFLCLPIDDGAALQASQRRLHGRTWYVYPVTRDALFPLAVGKKTLPAVELQISPAGSFFSRGQDVKVRSAVSVIDVRPLPEGAPSTFSIGSVGQFQLTVSARPKQVKVGEPFTLVVEATGVGNVDQITLPTWSGDAHVRLFPPSERRERRDRDGVVAGHVVQETLVQPQDSGDVVVPALSLTTFSPADGRYLTSTSASLVVRVQGVAVVGAKARARTVLSAGPRSLVLDAAVREDVVENDVVYGGGGAGLLFSVLGVVLGVRRRQGATEISRQRQRQHDRARDLAATRDLSVAAGLLLDAVGDRCGDDVRSTPLQSLPALLMARGVPSALAQRSAAALLLAEAARYSPGGQQVQARDDVVAAALAIDAFTAAVPPLARAGR